ncbi:MAG: GDP-mannose mannosyl hydrolase [Erwinia billingiae]
MFLNDRDFATVVRSTPLVSIDFIVENQDGKYLVGYRTNCPAKGFWFVPGGRIRKDETFDEAFIRLTKLELGKEISLDDGLFNGVWQHFYDDNFDGQPYTTHYIVLSFQLQVDSSALQLSKEQHSDYLWLTSDELLHREDVHSYTRAYFTSSRQTACLSGQKLNGQDHE